MAPQDPHRTTVYFVRISHKNHIRFTQLNEFALGINTCVYTIGELPSNLDFGLCLCPLQMSYPGPEGRTYYFTTETAIIPDNFPHEDCQGMGCTGMLL